MSHCVEEIYSIDMHKHLNIRRIKMTEHFILDLKSFQQQRFNHICFQLFHHYGEHCISMQPDGLLNAGLLNQLPKQASFDIGGLDFGHWYAKLSYAGMYLNIDAAWCFEMKYKDLEGQVFVSKI